MLVNEIKLRKNIIILIKKIKHAANRLNSNLYLKKKSEQEKIKLTKKKKCE